MEKTFARGAYFAIKIVAKVGYAHDWAAYAGPSDWDDDKVAAEGDKISETAAASLFPDLNNSLYYRR